MCTTARPLAPAAIAIALAASLGPHAAASPRDAAAAQPPAPDKSAYTLVNPRPASCGGRCLPIGPTSPRARARWMPEP